MPRTKANTVTDLQAANLNPFANTAVAGGQTVQLLIRYEGVNPDLDGLVDVIETKYGAGKVSLDDDVAARGILRLRVIA